MPYYNENLLSAWPSFQVCAKPLQPLVQSISRGGTCCLNVPTSSSDITGDDEAGGDTLLNIVIQFRKVCNHPELFERAESVAVPNSAYLRIVHFLSPQGLTISPIAHCTVPYQAGTQTLGARTQVKNTVVQERLALSDETHPTLHLYNTQQQATLHGP